MINILADNPTWTLEDAIERVDEMDGDGLASLRIRIIPAWDSQQGWRFFFRYPDGSLIETGRPMVFPRPEQEEQEM